MIEKIDFPEQLAPWTQKDLFSVRVLSLLQSYGCQYRFCSFYRQTDGEKLTAIIAKLDGNVTIALTEDYDRDELVRFLCLIGYATILVSDVFELNPRYTEGVIMACSRKPDVVLEGAVLDEYPKLMDLFNFVDYAEQDFKAWYVDISHRVRHKTARAYTLNVNGEIVSSGILSSLFEGDAVLTAVRTREDLRRRGYGSALVKAICNDVKGTVYLMRDADRNEAFYTQAGFQNIGKWRMYQ